MAKIKNATVKAEAKRVCDNKIAKAGDSGVFEWTARDMAIVAVRAVLVEMGCKAELGDDMKESRTEVVDALEEMFTAPINYRRTYLIPEGLAPKMPEKTEKAKSDDNI